MYLLPLIMYLLKDNWHISRIFYGFSRTIISSYFNFIDRVYVNTLTFSIINAIDVSYEVEESVKEYTEDLIDFIVNDIKGNFGVVTFEHLVLYGGGANWLRNKITSKKINIVVLEEPEFANAYGFEIKAREALAQEQEELEPAQDQSEQEIKE